MNDFILGGFGRRSNGYCLRGCHRHSDRTTLIFSINHDFSGASWTSLPGNLGWPLGQVHTHMFSVPQFSTFSIGTSFGNRTLHPSGGRFRIGTRNTGRCKWKTPRLPISKNGTRSFGTSFHRSLSYPLRRKFHSYI
jgi:hypothetical protein